MTHPYHIMALNNAWANATLYSALSGLSDAEFAAPRTGFFPSLHQTLDHIWRVDLYYVDSLEHGREGRAVFDRDGPTSVSGLAQAQADVDMRLARFCQDADLSAICTIPRRTGPVKETTGALLLHLFQHQIHHRGQAHTMIGETGIAPPQLDEFFLENGRAPSAQAYVQPRN